MHVRMQQSVVQRRQPSLSRIKIENKATYPNINVCNQCGACIEICPTKALERDANGIVQVRKDKYLPYV